MFAGNQWKKNNFKQDFLICNHFNENIAIFRMLLTWYSNFSRNPGRKYEILRIMHVGEFFIKFGKHSMEKAIFYKNIG